MKTVFFLLLIGLVSCNTDEQTTTDTTTDTTTTTTNENPPLTKTDDCYMQVIGRDSIKAHLVTDGNKVSGNMAFDNYQKDSSHGPVDGQQEDDKYVLWYSFESEGMHSVMQLVFKKTDNGLIRGVGPMENRGDTALFTNMQQIRFDDKDLLRKTSCDSLGTVAW